MTAVCAWCRERHPVAEATLKIKKHGCPDVGWFVSTLEGEDA